MNPKNRFPAFELLRHPWFVSAKINTIYQYIPKILCEIKELECENEEKKIRTAFFNDCESEISEISEKIAKISEAFFSLKDLVSYFRIFENFWEKNLMLSENIEMLNPIKKLPYLFDIMKNNIYNKDEPLFIQKIISFPISFIFNLIKEEILKFYYFKKNCQKDFIQSFLKNICIISKSPGNGENQISNSSERDEKNSRKVQQQNSASLGTKLLSKMNIGKISKMFSSNTSSQSVGSGNEEKKAQTIENGDNLMDFFSIKIQIHLFYLYIFDISLKKKTISSFFYVLYKLPIPDTLRIMLWRKILEVSYDTKAIFSFLTIDNIYPNKNRCIAQIEADIPRCHQYNPLMNSYYGKIKLYELLVSLLNLDKNITYLQGFDSMGTIALAATQFHNDLACILLYKIINKTVKNFIFQGEKNYVKEYLLVFQWILFFVEPLLAKHLMDLGFYPELYAVSWILNLFSSPLFWLKFNLFFNI